MPAHDCDSPTPMPRLASITTRASAAFPTMPQREGYANSLLFTVSLCCVFTICVALLRLWIRRSAYGRDDAVVGAATILALGHMGSSYASISFGLGKPWSRIGSEGSLAELNEVRAGDGEASDGTDVHAGIHRRGSPLLSRLVSVQMRNGLLPHSHHQDTIAATPLPRLQRRNGVPGFGLHLCHNGRLPLGFRLLLGVQPESRNMPFSGERPTPIPQLTVC